jgi:hypothetical protein
MPCKTEGVLQSKAIAAEIEPLLNADQREAYRDGYEVALPLSAMTGPAQTKCLAAIEAIRREACGSTGGGEKPLRYELVLRRDWKRFGVNEIWKGDRRVFC